MKPKRRLSLLLAWLSKKGILTWEKKPNVAKESVTPSIVKKNI